MPATPTSPGDIPMPSIMDMEFREAGARLLELGENYKDDAPKLFTELLDGKLHLARDLAYMKKLFKMLMMRFHPDKAAPEDIEFCNEVAAVINTTLKQRLDILRERMEKEEREKRAKEDNANAERQKKEAEHREKEQKERQRREQEEAAKRQREEEERKRREEEEQRKRQQEEQQRRQREEEERKKREAEEQKRAKEEALRQLQQQLGEEQKLQCAFLEKKDAWHKERMEIRKRKAERRLAKRKAALEKDTDKANQDAENLRSAIEAEKRHIKSLDQSLKIDAAQLKKTKFNVAAQQKVVDYVESKISSKTARLEELREELSAQIDLLKYHLQIKEDHQTAAEAARNERTKLLNETVKLRKEIQAMEAAETAAAAA